MTLSKVLITLTDKADGTVRVDVDYEPGVISEKELTPAQQMSTLMLDALIDHNDINVEEPQ